MSEPHPMDNRRIASALREAAAFLSQQKANPFRVLAYRKAADAVEVLREPLASEHAEVAEVS